MADIVIRGFLDKMHFLPNQTGGIIQVSEFRKGFTKNDGTYVDDKYITWKILFKNGQATFINKHFNTGMLVKVKGEVLPYAVEHNVTIDGYTVFMDSISVDSFPRNAARQEFKTQKESQMHSDESPDLEEYEKPYF